MTTLFRQHTFWWLSALLILTHCGPQDAKPDDTRSRERAARQATPPAVDDVLQPVTLPALDNLQAAVRTQLQDQYTRVQALENQEAAPTVQGEAYGLMGQLLLAYDFDSAAEIALRHAQRLLPERFTWPYYLGYLLQRTNNLDAARERYEHVLTLRPDDVATHIHLAEVYRDLERVEDARNLLQRALQLDPRCAAAHYLLGQLADTPAAAISHYEAVLRIQPDASTVHYPLGMAYREQGDMDRSRDLLARRGDTSVRLADPLLQQLDDLKQGSQALLFKGSQLMQQRRYQEAAALFEQVVAEDQDNEEGHLNLGAALAQLGRADEAMDALEQSLRLDPANPKAHFNLGVLYGGQGDETSALRHFQAAVDHDPSYNAARYALAKLLWRNRQCREALPHLAAFLAARPKDIESRINRAICHVDLGDYAAARALLEAGLDAFPNHPGLQDALVRVLAASADDDVRDGPRALDMAERLVASLRRAETLESLAMAYAEQERFQEAVQIQQAALQMARQQGLTTWLDHLNANLARYQNHQPCRSPWHTVIFEK